MIKWEDVPMEAAEREMTAIERARDYGIDISLLDSCLRLTPEERLIGLEGMLALAEEFARARDQGRAATSPASSMSL